MHDAGQAIRLFLDGSMRSPDLLRALVSHTPWHVPAVATPEGPQPRHYADDEGGQWLRVYSSDEALTQAGYTGPTLSVSAATWISWLTDDLAGVDMDAETTGALHYKCTQFEFLRRGAACLDVEAVLAGEPREGGFGILRDYDGWQVVGRQNAARFQMAMVPDRQGRRLAAAFTASDAADAFVRTHGLFGQGVRVVNRRGTDLFAQLDAMDIDGVVFNCVGPTRPVAVARSFAPAVLDGVDGPPIPSALPARTVAEAHLFMDIRQMAAEREQAAVERDGRVVMVYAVDGVEIVFDIPDEGLQDATLGPGRSALLGPDEFVQYATDLASGVPADPSSLDADLHDGARARLLLAAQCIDQALRFATDAGIPRSDMRTVAGRRLHRRDEGTYARERLEAVAAAYRVVSARY
jgi:hypothetical protein